jgi:hypothetical protein
MFAQPAGLAQVSLEPFELRIWTIAAAFCSVDERYGVVLIPIQQPGRVGRR